MKSSLLATRAIRRPWTMPVRQRWVHVDADGAEIDYHSPPEDRPSIEVTLLKSRKKWIDETTTTRGRRPLGEGWVLDMCDEATGLCTWVRRIEWVFKKKRFSDRLD